MKIILVAFLFFLIAFVYSSVGLGGGSAYVGVLGLLNVDIRYIPSTAQFLNIVVSSVGFLNFKRHLDKAKIKLIILICTFGILGVYIGTEIILKKNTFFYILGTLLIISSLLTFLRDFILNFKIRINHLLLPAVSFVLGFFTGLVGIGGGIFLSPILLLSGFPVKEVASITTLYIFLNSSFGFVKNFLDNKVDYTLCIVLGFVVLIGGFLGSYLGSTKLRSKFIEIVLIIILLIIGGSLIWKGIST